MFFYLHIGILISRESKPELDAKSKWKQVLRKTKFLTLQDRVEAKTNLNAIKGSFSDADNRPLFLLLFESDDRQKEKIHLMGKFLWVMSVNNRKEEEAFFCVEASGRKLKQPRRRRRRKAFSVIARLHSRHSLVGWNFSENIRITLMNKKKNVFLFSKNEEWMNWF